MSEGWLLSRISLRRDASVAALLPLLEPARPGVGHHLLWYLFADEPARRRDFLWREIAPGRFLVLSARSPEDHHGLFDIESKPFAPVLAAGDRFWFSLRANPTVAKRSAKEVRSKRRDVVMNAIYDKPTKGRAAARSEAILTAGYSWLAARAVRCGFALPPENSARTLEGLRISGYRVEQIARGAAKGLTVARLDFDGVLTVTDPQRFLAALTRGIGPAKAYGCGLLLIRRARRGGDFD